MKRKSFYVDRMALFYRTKVTENEVTLSDEELLNDEEPQPKETGNTKKKTKMTSEELTKVLSENPCIEDLKNGLYRCSLCNRNINSKTQIITHIGSSQ